MIKTFDEFSKKVNESHHNDYNYDFDNILKMETSFQTHVNNFKFDFTGPEYDDEIYKDDYKYVDELYHSDVKVDLYVDFSVEINDTVIGLELKISKPRDIFEMRAKGDVEKTIAVMDVLGEYSYPFILDVLDNTEICKGVSEKICGDREHTGVASVFLSDYIGFDITQPKYIDALKNMIKNHQ